jgi:hypothetical protein
MVVIRLLGQINGAPTPYDGLYLMKYQVGIEGVDPHGARMSALVEATSSLALARKFKTSAEAVECYRQIDPRIPHRADGRPNRPLTAFTVSIETLPEPERN